MSEESCAHAWVVLGQCARRGPTYVNTYDHAHCALCDATGHRLILAMDGDFGKDDQDLRRRQREDREECRALGATVTQAKEDA